MIFRVNRIICIDSSIWLSLSKINSIRNSLISSLITINWTIRIRSTRWTSRM